MSLWAQPNRAPARRGRGRGRGRRGRRGGTAALLVVILMVIGTLAVVVLRGGDPEPAAPGQQGSAARAAADGGSVERTLPVPPPTGGVVLPGGRTTAAGYPVGFPDTDLGAVAAAVEITRAQVGFDYDQAATVARAYAAPDDLEVLITRAREAVGYRRQRLGVVGTGGVAAPAAFALVPFAFQVLEMDPGCYAVTVLSLASTTTVRGRLRNVYYAGTQLVGWVNDDWKALAGSPEQRQRLLSSRQPPAAVSPNDPRFRRAGWITITTRPASP